MFTINIYKAIKYDEIAREYIPTKSEDALMMFSASFSNDLLDYVSSIFKVINYDKSFIIATPMEYSRTIHVSSKTPSMKTITGNTSVITRFLTADIGLSDDEIGVIQ